MEREVGSTRIEREREKRAARFMESADIRHIGSIPLRFAPVPRFASLWQPSSVRAYESTAVADAGHRQSCRVSIG